MVTLENVRKEYGEQVAVDGINLEIEAGQLVVLIGPSGCGKTTSLKMINRLIEPTSGEIRINGKSIAESNPVELRRQIGYVIQQIGLFPNMTIAQNVDVVPKLLKWSADKRNKRVAQLLNMVDMDPGTFANRYPNELSGGQQQRIGVLRALAAEPPLVLMDEPFGALDPITREMLQDEIKRLQKQLDKTIVFVTHDMDEAIKIADVIVIMKEGRIVQADSPEEILSNPANDFVEQFIGKRRLQTSEVNTVEEVMNKNPITVPPSRKLHESLALMRMKGVDSLLIVDDFKRLMGRVTIAQMSAHGRPGQAISEIMDQDVPTVSRDATAQEAFDMLVNKNQEYLVVVDGHKRVLGLVTKTSMVRALAGVVWKDMDNE